jgi:hypothetical protein
MVPTEVSDKERYKKERSRRIVNQVKENSKKVK